MDPKREDEFIQEALRIVKAGEEKGIILRLMGAIAVRLHCPNSSHILEGMERSLTDIDLMSYGKHNPKMKKLFTELGYTPNERIIAFYGRDRHIYDSQEKGWHVDVFFDELKMCHTIHFQGRLELDYPTITPTDILLEKLQIVRINPKDVKDTIVLMREHPVGKGEKDSIDGDYTLKLLSGDWGFYYTVTENLKKLKGFLPEFGVLTGEDRADVSGKIDSLLENIERVPKSLKWKMRAKIGAKRKWYNEVEEVER